MAVAKCGQRFSWSTPMWCKGTDNKKCANCPLNIKFKNSYIDEEYDT